MTLLEWRKLIEKALSDKGFTNVSLEAKWLIEGALEKQSLTLIPSYIPSEDEKTRIQEWLERRLQGEPLSRIKGFREFWSLPFYINEHTLDPRPETELIVEGVMGWIKQQKLLIERLKGNPQPSLRAPAGGAAIHLKNKKDGLLPPAFARGRNDAFKWRILDLGTGSGCLLISLLHELKNANGIGIDISEDALEVARSNAILNGVSERSTFHQGNWGEGLTGLYDIIVSNPPYIPLPDRETLDSAVRDFDPPTALFGGVDGLDCYRLLALEVKRLIAPEGIAVMEIGMGQRPEVEKIFKDAGLQVKFVLKDLAGIERVVGIGVVDLEQ